MIHRFLTPLILLAAVTAFTACAPEPALPSGPARPALWVVHDADTRIVVLGAVHQLPANLDWMRGRLAQEADFAAELWLELAPEESTRAAALFAATASNERVAPLTSRLAAQNAAEIAARLRTIGIANPDLTESWALALTLGAAQADAAGLDNSNGVEAILTRRFTARSLPVRGLETAVQQLTLFDTLPPRVQDRLLTSTIDQADGSRARIVALLSAWATGDVDRLAAIANDQLTVVPGLAEPLVYARNRAWADALAARMDQRGDIMVAVGVGHLVGPQSLLDELRARGLRPLRLQ